VIPEALTLLANLGQPRRPAGASAPQGEPILPDVATASRQLAPLSSWPVTGADLPALRRVQQAAVHAANALLNETPVDCAEISALAHHSTGRIRLSAQADGSLCQRLAWQDFSFSGYLARRLIAELATLDPKRWRRCARAECHLLFYDTSRSRTQRWHSENPCGWRERQRQHRARPSP
jgi:predicted RNA-binding Zn ribbon-like protein